MWTRGNANLTPMIFSFPSFIFPMYLCNIQLILQEKNILKKNNFYFAFVDLGNTFDRVLRDSVWLASRKLGAAEGLVSIVQPMCRSAWSFVRVNGTFSNDFLIQIRLSAKSFQIFHIAESAIYRNWVRMSRGFLTYSSNA